MREPDSGKRIGLIFCLFPSYIHTITKTIESISRPYGVLIDHHRRIISEKCGYQYKEWWLSEMKIGHEIIHNIKLISWSYIDRCWKIQDSRLSTQATIMYPIVFYSLLCDTIPILASIRIKSISYILIEWDPEIWKWLERTTSGGSDGNDFLVFSFYFGNILEYIYAYFYFFSVDIVVTDIESLYSLECTESHMECEVFFLIFDFAHQFTREVEWCSRGCDWSIMFRKTRLIVSFFLSTILDVGREREDTMGF